MAEAICRVNLVGTDSIRHQTWSLRLPASNVCRPDCDLTSRNSTKRPARDFDANRSVWPATRADDDS